MFFWILYLPKRGHLLERLMLQADHRKGLEGERGVWEVILKFVRAEAVARLCSSTTEVWI